jgi:hypothetical protein
MRHFIKGSLQYPGIEESSKSPMQNATYFGTFLTDLSLASG